MVEIYVADKMAGMLKPEFNVKHGSKIICDCGFDNVDKNQGWFFSTSIS